MRFNINLRISPAYKTAVDRKTLRAAARAALEHEAAPTPGALTVVLTDDAALRRLNRDYLGHDYSTDVLSFPSNATDPETGERYFGDIAISLPRARAQADAGGHPVSAELQLLVVHGVLHLLGHDHAKAKEKARMWAAQAEVLKKLHAPITGPLKTHINL
jgi:probable rRNA maturation factor